MGTGAPRFWNSDEVPRPLERSSTFMMLIKWRAAIDVLPRNPLYVYTVHVVYICGHPRRDLICQINVIQLENLLHPYNRDRMRTFEVAHRLFMSSRRAASWALRFKQLIFAPVTLIQLILIPLILQPLTLTLLCTVIYPPPFSFRLPTRGVIRPHYFLSICL